MKDVEQLRIFPETDTRKEYTVCGVDRHDRVIVYDCKAYTSKQAKFLFNKSYGFLTPVISITEH